MKISSRFCLVLAVAVGVLICCGASAFAQQPPKGPAYSNVRYEDDYSFLNNGGSRGSDPFNQLKPKLSDSSFR